jgi:hypothetical protein
MEIRCSEDKHATLKLNYSCTSVLDVYSLLVKWPRRQVRHFSQAGDKFNNVIYIFSIHHGAVFN